jgi:hypothetical protein
MMSFWIPFIYMDGWLARRSWWHFARFKPLFHNLDIFACGTTAWETHHSPWTSDCLFQNQEGLDPIHIYLWMSRRRLEPLFVNLDIFACGITAGRLSTMPHGGVVVSFKVNSFRITFICMAGCLDDLGANWYVWNQYLSTLIYILLGLQLGDYPSCPMDE